MPHGWETMPWFGMILGPIMMIVMFAIMIMIVLVIVRWLGGGSSSGGGTYLPFQRDQNTALDILKKRFANGEIDKEEFEECRRVLGE